MVKYGTTDLNHNEEDKTKIVKKTIPTITTNQYTVDINSFFALWVLHSLKKRYIALSIPQEKTIGKNRPIPVDNCIIPYSSVDNLLERKGNNNIANPLFNALHR